MAVTINGTTGIDKVQDGTITSADLASGVGGKVLQVVYGSTTTRAATSSTSFVASNISASITPSSTSNKVLIIVACSGNNNNTNGTGMTYTLYRDSTNLGHSSLGFGWVRGASERVEAGVGITYQDSPNTTSSITYQVYFRTQNSGTVELSAQDGAVSGIILMEIAG